MSPDWITFFDGLAIAEAGELCGRLGFLWVVVALQVSSGSEVRDWKAFDAIVSSAWVGSGSTSQGAGARSAPGSLQGIPTRNQCKVAASSGEQSAGDSIGQKAPAVRLGTNKITNTNARTIGSLRQNNAALPEIPQVSVNKIPKNQARLGTLSADEPDPPRQNRIPLTKTEEALGSARKLAAMLSYVE